jgi:hypothetical protein
MKSVVLSSGGVFVTMRSVYQKEGVTALFSGVVPRTMWISIGVLFVSLSPLLLLFYSLSLLSFSFSPYRSPSLLYRIFICWRVIF